MSFESDNAEVLLFAAIKLQASALYNISEAVISLNALVHDLTMNDDAAKYINEHLKVADELIKKSNENLESFSYFKRGDDE